MLPLAMCQHRLGELGLRVFERVGQQWVRQLQWLGLLGFGWLDRKRR